MSVSEATQEQPESLTNLSLNRNLNHNLNNMLKSDPTEDFAEQSQLTYLVPLDTSLDIESAFKNLEPGISILDSLKRRDNLFFGKLFPSAPSLYADR